MDRRDTVIDWPVGINRLSESAAEVDTARLIMHHDTREIFARARRGEMPSLEARARYRRDHAYMAKLCVQSVNRLFEASGGHGIHEASAIQRFHRDIQRPPIRILTWDPWPRARSPAVELNASDV